MCGRYALTLPPDAMKRVFGYSDTPNFPPRYNIAPTQPVPVVRIVNGERRFDLMRWGFIPGWVKTTKDFPLVINIRSETVRSKPSFRAAFVRRRALMPADGFYEWQRVGRAKRPFLFRRPERALFAFAALFETWMAPDGGEIDTAALLTTTANGLVSAVHDRMPVILPAADHEAWLDARTSPEDAFALLRPPPDDCLEMVPVSASIGNVANDGPEVQSADAAGDDGGSQTTRQPSRPPTASRQGDLF